jgi:DUF1680 family protein
MINSFVADTSQSPAARLRPVPVSAVKLGDGFWGPRIKKNWRHGIPRLFGLLESHGVLNNFRRIYGAHDGPRIGFLFTDSDLYKWMEAAAYTLQGADLPEIRDMLEQSIQTILPAQASDGYLNSWFIDELAEQRWSDLDSAHELYCAGHLVGAAIAHYRIGGATQLLDCAIRFADHIDTVFRVGKRSGAPGHPGIEMALVELYRTTRDRRYLDLAGRFLEERSLTSRTEISGHAVRATYFMTGAIDFFLETGFQPYLNIIERQWKDMILHKIYVTGGIGGRYMGEAFGEPYELPNERAYAETCAAVGTVFWNWRMLQFKGNGQYCDWLEHTLYNGFLAGVSLSADEFFYVNPLASSGAGEDDPWYGWARREPHQRKPWYDCTCCPPNAQRLLASLGSYFYSTSADGLWIHLFDKNELHWQLKDGSPVCVVQETDYPWAGIVRITIRSDSPKLFTVYVRIPAWAKTVSGKINDRAITDIQPGEYLRITRVWKDEHVEISLEMPVEMISSSSLVAGNRGAVVIQRGPLIYCLEGVDHQDHDVRKLRLQHNPSFWVEHDPRLLGGVTRINARGLRPKGCCSEPLYRPVSSRAQQDFDAFDLVFVPYYAWANRGTGSMAVWVPLGA